MHTPKQEHQSSTPQIIIQETELERLKRDIYRSDMEKFLLFTQMLRRNTMLKKAKITHR